MQVFVTVVDCGTQSAAAEKLDLSRPVVSRLLAELEAWAGARLLHRTTRKLSLTAAGNEILPRCRQVLELAADMRAAVAAPQNAPQGLLRIAVSTSFGQAQLARAQESPTVLELDSCSSVGLVLSQQCAPPR
jgi:DNA-binding transcriptional LysR family regulator